MGKIDLSEFERLSQTAKRKRCGVGIALGLLLEEERVQMNAALAADKLDISAGAIAKWCDRRDIALNHNSVSSHRARSCSCYDSD